MDVNGLSMALLCSFRRRCRCTPAVICSHAQVAAFEHRHARQGMQSVPAAGRGRHSPVWAGATARAADPAHDSHKGPGLHAGNAPRLRVIITLQSMHIDHSTCAEHVLKNLATGEPVSVKLGVSSPQACPTPGGGGKPPDPPMAGRSYQCAITTDDVCVDNDSNRFLCHPAGTAK